MKTTKGDQSVLQCSQIKIKLKKEQETTPCVTVGAQESKQWGKIFIFYQLFTGTGHFKQFESIRTSVEQRRCLGGNIKVSLLLSERKVLRRKSDTYFTDLSIKLYQ